MKARPGELELAEARVFWSTLSASSMVREAIAKERAVPETVECEWYGRNLGQHDWVDTADGFKRCTKCKNEDLRAVPDPLDRGILSNEVNIPHINVITIACIALACEVCLVAGFLIGTWVAR